MAELQPGLSKEILLTVTEAITAKHLGSGTLAVLATPSMIALMEGTSHQMVTPFLTPQQSTVGVLVNVRHLAATPLGMAIRIHSELVSVEGRKLTFKVEAYDAVEKIGEGVHERFVIDLARFEDRLKRKTEGKLTA
jgi:fluoroacetyl-CoA thioesterase